MFAGGKNLKSLLAFVQIGIQNQYPDSKVPFKLSTHRASSGSVKVSIRFNTLGIW